MSIIAALWQSIETQNTNGQSLGKINPQNLSKIDELVFSEDIENIRNGLTMMTTIAAEYLCRYLKLNGDSVVLRDAGKFGTPLSAERMLVESAKGNSMWEDLYDSGAFGLMEHNIFIAFGDVAIEDLSESEKEFCVRMAKEMVRVPAGEFMMGALEDDGDAYDSEKPRHKVTLTRDFMIGKYQVTQVLWDSVMGSNPSTFTGANRPVERVRWFDVVEFCNKLSVMECLEPAYTINGANVTCNWSAKGYRLPTEAEWEYSARGGEYHKYAGSDNVDEVAWYWNNSDMGVGRREPHPVGLKKPNGFGLYDMSGNVWEWVWDWWSDDYSIEMSTRMSTSVSIWEALNKNLFTADENQQESTENNLDSVENPTGNPTGSRRVCRGGRSNDLPKNVRTSIRFYVFPSSRGNDLGFRICRFL